MSPEFIIIIILATVSASPSNVAKNELQNQLEVISQNTSCSSSKYLINLKFNRSFRGIVYAKGYPYTRLQKQDKGCYAYGAGENSLELSLKTNGCGIRLIHRTDEKLTYVVTLIVQSDKFLQQVTNFEIATQCSISTSKVVENDLKHHRSGKRLKIEETALPVKVKAWMEIQTTSGGSITDVGDQLTVVVKTYLPERVAACVSNCIAHDGLRERTENLTDSRGCAFDSALVPSMVESDELERDVQKEIGYRLHKSETTFAAFKFADAPSLHLKCTLDFFKESCPKRYCDENSVGRMGRSSKEPKLLDTLDVFNSVGVVAPGIDGDVIQSKKEPVSEGREICLTMTDITIHLALLAFIIIFMSLCIFSVYWRSTSKKRDYYSGSVLITREQYLRGRVNRSFEA